MCAFFPRQTVLLLALAAGTGLAVTAQNNPLWNRVGGTSLNAGLASLASGPVRSVWYSPGGERLLAWTASGRIFETSDFEHWKLNTTDIAVAPEAAVQGRRSYYLTAANLFASEDGGRTRFNLTGFNNVSVIGGGFTGIAVSPVNPQEVTTSNQFGVWRSLDGGLSWSGLNEGLPNLEARRLVDARRLVLADGAVVNLADGAWNRSGEADPNAQLLSRLNLQAATAITAAAQSGRFTYAGMADGTLVTLVDQGAARSHSTIAERVERIWSDPERPQLALAAVGNHLFRTVNAGVFWDDVTGQWNGAGIHGIAADWQADAVYIAADTGVFMANLALNAASLAQPQWRPVAADLAAARAWDVRLGKDNMLEIVLDGYGVYETQAPHKSRALRVVNGADMSERAAAPGSVVSILGGSVTRAAVGQGAWPVLAAAAQSSQLQVPFDTVPGRQELALDSALGRFILPLVVKAASPALFVDSDNAPMMVDPESGLVLDPNLALHGGSTIQLLATGLGRVTPDWPTGVPAPAVMVPVVRGHVTAFLDGQPVAVTSATLAPGYIGYYLVELRLPSFVNRGVSELRLAMDGQESNRVRVYLEPSMARQ